MRRFATAVVVLFAMLVPAVPAQAAPSPGPVSQLDYARRPANAADCDPFNDNDIYCVYYNSLATGEVRRFFPLPPRNTCIDARAPLGSAYGSYTNETFYRWFQFNTLSCGGSHWETPPFSSGVNPGGWHVAIMRTSLRS
jgi:hypothetical protein